MTIAAIIQLASLLIIGILRKVRESREEIPAEQVNKSTVKTEEVSEPLPEPQSEILVENPPHQVKEKKTASAKKTPAKSAPAKKTATKK